MVCKGVASHSRLQELSHSLCERLFNPHEKPKLKQKISCEGDVAPVSTAEELVACLIMLVGLVVFGFIISGSR